MPKGFSAQIKGWSEKAIRNAENVIKDAGQDLFEEAQRPVSQGGSMPVDTGFLRNSLVSQLNGSAMGTGATSYVFALAGFKLGDTMFGGWTAEYAEHVNYGTSKMQGRFYVDLAAQKWQLFINKAAAKYES